MWYTMRELTSQRSISRSIRTVPDGCKPDDDRQKRKYPPMTEASDDRFIRFSHATEAVLKAITKYKNECLARYGLRGMHLMTLICLSRAPDGLTSGDISRLCAVDKAFVSRVTGELKTLGYLEAAEGRYNARVTLTGAGRTVTGEIYGMLNDAVERITAGVPAEDVETFYGVLERFGKNLDVMNHKNGKKDAADSTADRPDGAAADGGTAI